MQHNLAFRFHAVIVTALWIMKNVEEFFLSTNFDANWLFLLRLKKKGLSHQKSVTQHNSRIIQSFVYEFYCISLVFKCSFCLCSFVGKYYMIY